MDGEGWEEINASTSMHDTCREMMHGLAGCQHPKDFLVCMARTFGVLRESILSNNEDFSRSDGKEQVSGKDACVTLRLCVEQLQQAQKDIVSWVRTWWYSNYFEEFASILLNDVVPRLEDKKKGVSMDSHPEVFCWFELCSTMDLLRVVSTYLSLSGIDQDLLLRKKRNRRTVVVVPVSYELAADILGARLFGDTGDIFKIMEMICKNIGGKKDAVQLDEAFVILVALADYGAALPKDHVLHYSWYVGRICEACMEYCRNNFESTVTSKASGLILAGAIMAKFASRGFDSWVVESLVAGISSQDCAWETPLVRDICMHMPEYELGTQKVVVGLLNSVSGGHDVDAKGQAEIFDQFVIPYETWRERTDFRLLLGDTILVKGPITRRMIDILLEYFCILNRKSSKTVFQSVMNSVAVSWSGPLAVNTIPIKQQQVMTYFLSRALHYLSAVEIQEVPGLVPGILKGISLHLECPRQVIRQHGMCVGNALSSRFTPDKPLIFDPIDIEDILHHSGPVHETKKPDLTKTMVVETAGANSDGITETDSDDESAFSDDSEFSGCSDNSNEDREIENADLRLQQVVQMLRNSESDWKGQIQALRAAEILIRASPCELPAYAESLSCALIYSKLPKWVDDEIQESQTSKTGEEHRFHAMVSLAVEVPSAVGRCLIESFYSPSSDLSHRARALQILGSASQEFSRPGSVLKPIQFSPGTDSLDSARVRINGESRKEIRSMGPILLEWTTLLLQDCSLPRHGLDLFGRDSYLLGCLLCTLGTFVHTIAGSPESLYLSIAVLQLIQADSVRNNVEIFARRAALAAASQAIMSVPVPAVANAISSNILEGNSRTNPNESSDPVNTFLQLAWETNDWFGRIAKTDIDETCQKLGHGGSHLFQSLTCEALEYKAKEVAGGGLLSSQGTRDLQFKATKSIKVPSEGGRNVDLL
eukprot:jgi/Picsp_1/1364/NSC_04843-R1_telomere length regulation protein tel2 homolog